MQANIKSGCIGVCWDKYNSYWKAYITIEHRRYSASFRVMERAIEWRKEAERLRDDGCKDPIIYKGLKKHMEPIKPKHSDTWEVHVRDGELEYTCSHHIGHWHWPHSCDGCCRGENYPGRKKEVSDDDIVQTE